ncbi:putative HET-domain-containing protein [Seiridium unicorne]|uniref:HET-domain-containing protein n=1 Tax=Seiridium unicorne TaxID=138068 RepID=A0ABR2V6J5_9PEZI
MHDPFQHPAIKEHLPDNLTGKTFPEWVEGQNTLQKYLPFYNVDWPFGTSKDDHKLGAQVEDEEVLIQRTESEDSQFGADEFAVGATFLAQASLTRGMMVETDPLRVKAMSVVSSTLPSLALTVRVLQKKLPVAVSVIMHNKGSGQDGLLNVDVWGYGNALGAPLSMISHFRLRVESSSPYIRLEEESRGRISRKAH